MWVIDDAFLEEGQSHYYCIRTSNRTAVRPNISKVDCSLNNNPGALFASVREGFDGSVDATECDFFSAITKATLVWHDHPSLPSAGGKHLVNDLDLILLKGGGAQPSYSPPRDDTNNVEQLRLVAGLPYLIQIAAIDVPMPLYGDGVTGRLPRGQPYSLVATGPNIEVAEVMHKDGRMDLSVCM
ncbi:hypothetical protein CYMTET_55492 [Cymbomonas tetramitiformis]|uniref:Uncharacterized protein n=1 Tax=Cymbomonas tetramitiformis TaxID=36881 RepID=A0AAE0BCV7_9CHLO|nr:hypothetical protein CYMTET_55492 [Cymbomonas tetramitiformis]